MYHFPIFRYKNSKYDFSMNTIATFMVYTVLTTLTGL